MKNMFSIENIDNKIKITYNKTEKIDVMLCLKLTSIDAIVETFKYTFNVPGHWVIPNFNYSGCKYLSIYDTNTNECLFNWLIPKELTNKLDRQKLICIGLNKTGTTSFKEDMINLGYEFNPKFECISKIMADVYHNDYNSLNSILDNARFDAYTDLPFSLPKVYEKIFEYRPNDVFILTLRNNSEEWANSVIKYFGWLMKETPYKNSEILNKHSGPIIERYSNFIVPMFQAWELTSFKNIENKLKDVYDRHVEDATNFFNKKNNKNFKTVTISKEGELKKLTNWLNIKNTKDSFSWVNKTEQN